MLEFAPLAKGPIRTSQALTEVHAKGMELALRAALPGSACGPTILRRERSIYVNLQQW